MNIESLYNHFKQDITHVHDMKMKLMKPSFFYDFMNKIQNKFDKNLSIVIQYYIAQYDSKNAAMQFNKEVMNMNQINDALKQSEQILYTQNEKVNEIINVVTADIDKLRKTIKQLTGYTPSQADQLNNSSLESVNQYTSLYSNKLYVFFITLIITLFLMFFNLLSKTDFIQCILVVLLLYIIHFIYYRYITLLFLPNGVSSVSIITDSSGNSVPISSEYSPTQYCMGSECCDLSNTQWINGQGCVAL
jgi:hypothetical protein